MARRVIETGRADIIVDDVTWIAVGRSAAEVQYPLERAAAVAIRRARDSRAAFKVAKTEAILFSKSQEHWK